MLAKLSLSDGRQYRAKMRWKAIEHKWKSREFRIFSSKCGWEKPISKILEITSVFLIVLSKNNKPSFHSVMQRKRNCCPLVIMQNSCNDFGFEISKCAHINIYSIKFVYFCDEEKREITRQPRFKCAPVCMCVCWTLLKQCILVGRCFLTTKLLYNSE